MAKVKVKYKRRGGVVMMDKKYADLLVKMGHLDIIEDAPAKKAVVAPAAPRPTREKKTPGESKKPAKKKKRKYTRRKKKEITEPVTETAET